MKPDDSLSEIKTVLNSEVSFESDHNVVSELSDCNNFCFERESETKDIYENEEKEIILKLYIKN